MNKNKVKRNRLLIFLIIFISIGFAYLSTNLSILGNALVSGNKWKIYFTNLQVLENKTGATGNAQIKEDDDTTVEFSVDLPLPGDSYSFNVDVKNEGTIDAQISKITNTLNGQTLETLPNYLEYSVTYSDGTAIDIGQILKSSQTKTINVSIGFKKDISSDELLGEDKNFSMSFKIEYQQADLTDMFYYQLKDKAVVDNIQSKYVEDERGIDFGYGASETNGLGLYIHAGTENNEFPIYYYRGNITDNNVKFGNYCWKIVRTTENGSIKMIYNGTPTETGTCDNTSDDHQLSETKKLSEDSSSPSSTGYSHGNDYPYLTDSSSIYAKSATYANGIYTLVDTQSSLDSTHHYACGGSATTCKSLRHYHYGDTYTYYVNLTNGMMIEDAMEDMFSNTKDSIIKDYIEDDWFEQNMLQFSEQIADTIYCNDRSIYSKGGWDANGGPLYTGASSLEFNTYRRKLNGAPDLSCQRTEDKFTVSSKLGNGALKYPVGLLTLDEAMLAGVLSSGSGDNYLHSGKAYWLMSPGIFIDIIQNNYIIEEDGDLSIESAQNNQGVRPVIALKNTVKIKSGNGEAATPYEFE